MIFLLKGIFKFRTVLFLIVGGKKINEKFSSNQKLNRITKIRE